MEPSLEEARANSSETGTAQLVYSCFLKVIDISTCGKGIEDRGHCFRNLDLEAFYRTVPPQPSGTIRLILDGRHRRIRLPRDVRQQRMDMFPKCDSWLVSNSIHHTPAPNPLYTSPAVIENSFRYHHLPTLRKLAGKDDEAGWYGVYCFAAHIDDCPSLSRLMDPAQSRFERSDAYFTICRNQDELLTVVCYAPDAFATPPDLRLQDYQCANASWRFLRGLEMSFMEAKFPSDIKNTSERELLQLILLKMAFANLEQTAKFLSYISSRMDDDDWRMVSRNAVAVRESRFVDMLGKRIAVLRTIEDGVFHISGAIQHLARTLLLLLKEHGSTKATSITTAYIDGIQQDCEYYKTWAHQLKSKNVEIHAGALSRFEFRQASSVSQLTILAAFFLPLSLAASILSMQTRFSDLNLLLYDFVGVVVILATIALVVGLITRYGQDFIKLMIRGRESRRSGFDGAGSKIVRVLVMCLWWMAILSSFLVGMIKDVVFGLKLFGFEAVGIVVTGWISYGYSEWIARREKMR